MRPRPLLIAGLVILALGGWVPARAIPGEEVPDRPDLGEPRVLILNSYHPGYGWSDGELRGLLNTLRAQRPRLLSSIEYMDWRRFPSPEREALLFKALELKYGGHPFDLIITLDDPALLFAYELRKLTGVATPIVFGGINHYTPETIRGQERVTGVAESTDVAGTVDLALCLQPETREVVVIYDQNESALESRRAVEAVMPRYASRVKFRFLGNWSVDELFRAVGNLKPGSVALLLSATVDTKGRLIADDAGFALELKQRCAVPLYMITQPMRPLFGDSDWNKDVWFGIGGSMLSSDRHGEAVGTLALRVLAGEPAGSIPVMTKSPTILAVDYSQMKRFDLPLSALPRGTEVFHQPVSFYRVYRTQIFVVVSVIGLLSATVLVLGINIVRRRSAESALLQSNERFQLIARATNDAVWDWKPETGELWWNDSYPVMLGVSADTPRNFESWAGSIHPEDRDRIVGGLKESMAGSAQTWDAEYRFRRSDGSDGFLFNRAFFLRAGDGRAIRVIGAMTDVTERNQSEQRSRRLAAVVEQTTELIAFLNLQGVLEYVNPAFTRNTGFSPIDVLGKPFDFITVSTDKALPFAEIAAMVKTAGVWSGRIKVRRKEDDGLATQLVVSPNRDNSGGLVNYIIVARDVTKETKLEEQVRFSQKMEAIGMLAGGVAHDFNNILQIISGHTQMILNFGLTEAERLEGLGQVKEAAERAAQLTRQLLVFSRKQPLLTENVDLRALVSDLLKMVRRLIGEHIAIEFAPGERLGNVRGNKVQLEQVVLNLCVNARDAMPKGGRLTIALENTQFDAAFCETHPWARLGNYVSMSVTDTGSGMDQPTLARIFDPFYSTKPKDRGTGLGLSVVYGIIQQHDGLIEVHSEVGVGSVFRICLPVVERGANAAREASTGVAERGTGTILLVEDENAVRQLATKILEKAGYRVLAAADGAEAIDLFKRHAEEVDLLVIDAVMPKLGGRETYECISAMRPGIPALFCSGYSADVLEPGFALGPDVQLLQKPYSSEELCRRIQNLLRAAGRSGRSRI
jgi:PAS domain S-box-containing protein